MKRCRSCQRLFSQEIKGQRTCSSCRTEHEREKWRRGSKRKWERIKEDPARLTSVHETQLRSYRKHRGERIERSIRRMKEWEKNHPERVRLNAAKVREKMVREWYGEVAIEQIRRKRSALGKKGEEITHLKVLPSLGYSEVYKPLNNKYPFDLLARKDGKIWAIEVSTHMRKTVRAHLVSFAEYLGWGILVVLVSPTWRFARVFEIFEQKTVMFRKGTNVFITD